MSISHINLVGFYPVLLQIMQLNCVQQTSISTRVNLSTSARGQHVCISLLLARGNTALPGALYIRWALPRISSFSVACTFDMILNTSYLLIATDCAPSAEYYVQLTEHMQTAATVVISKPMMMMRMRRLIHQLLPQ